MKYSIDEKNIIYANLDPKEGVVLNLTTKNYYRLNETAQFVWQKIAEQQSAEDIAKMMSLDFEVTYDEALKDVLEAIHHFKREQLLTVELPKADFSVEKAQLAKKKSKSSSKA